MTFPRWVLGGPDDTHGVSDSLLREVADGLFVGSALSVHHAKGNVAVMQFSRHCPVFVGDAVLRVPFADREPVPPAVLDAAVAFARKWRHKRPVWATCFAGLSRSASVAYAVLRRVDGLPHDEALTRVASRVEHFDRVDYWPHSATIQSVMSWCESERGGNGG